MELASLPHVPVPSQASVTSVTSAGGVRLRVARWRPTSRRTRGTVCLLQGRAEFIEKYFEVVAELRRRGFAVVAFDWRGQGGSDRLLANPRKGHVDDFADYEADLRAVAATVLAGAPQPHFALAHSMGGTVLVHALASTPDLFDRAVLTAPMFGIAGLRRPRGARLLAAALDVMGFGGAFIPAGGETAVATKPFEDNPLTRDPQRYARTGDLIAVAPSLGLGDPTIGWVHAAFRSMDPFRDPNYPLQIRTPILSVVPAVDRVTQTPLVERFCARLKAGRCLALAGAEHEILMERDPVRALFWAAFDAFVPGETPPRTTANDAEDSVEAAGAAAGEPVSG
ncbi:alpha/beta fold hydrolase [Alsobacter sp. R-9]